ncbi:hypothetical protein K438DRAFT_1783190 [Mycena galopus ATCC 62051]|nr:hypothetical protein K438DRAFT_1783190 [Mycena galopus ATCC 62051]
MEQLRLSKRYERLEFMESQQLAWKLLWAEFVHSEEHCRRLGERCPQAFRLLCRYLVWKIAVESAKMFSRASIQAGVIDHKTLERSYPTQRHYGCGKRTHRMATVGEMHQTFYKYLVTLYKAKQGTAWSPKVLRGLLIPLTPCAALTSALFGKFFWHFELFGIRIVDRSSQFGQVTLTARSHEHNFTGQRCGHAFKCRSACMGEHADSEFHLVCAGESIWDTRLSRKAPDFYGSGDLRNQLGGPLDFEEYTPLWIPTGWPLNLNEPAFGILRAGYRVQEEPEYTLKGIYFERCGHCAENHKIIEADTYYGSMLIDNLYGEATVNNTKKKKCAQVRLRTGALTGRRPLRCSAVPPVTKQV